MSSLSTPISIRYFEEVLKDCEEGDAVLLAESSFWLDALLKGSSVSWDNCRIISKSSSCVFAMEINAFVWIF